MAKETLKRYTKSSLDKREDRANAKLLKEPVGTFKKTQPAKTIDRAFVNAINAKGKTMAKETKKERERKADAPKVRKEEARGARKEDRARDGKKKGRK